MDPSLSLNVHLAVPQNSHSESHTPNTPEILNSIVNMTNGPFANFASSNSSSSAIPNNEDRTLSSSTTTSALVSNVSSPLTHFSAGTPEKSCSGLSVQQYCSQFIKEGLKMKVKRKLGANNSTKEDPVIAPPIKKPKISITPAPQPVTKAPPIPKPPRIEIKEELLSPDDLAKRLRRRERNKLAATKCRNKKKAQFTVLAQEHEDLKRQHVSFKSESARLEIEKRKLTEVLEKHKALIPSCPLFLVKQEESSTTVTEKEMDPSLEFRRSCSFSNTQQSANSDFFLAKSAITQSFYDLSSRCMAM
ncbi:activating transcription factor 3 [Lepeophtheirus salmonis]|uniref:BZIP domain-containing protein n=1 Tax=Lepeophtheirus salmonis TaxID=72036 RepID=A0A0K2TP91_LEPSM|nr:activating transcription factor 3-like [Lepeophtheirus salmonis]